MATNKPTVEQVMEGFGLERAEAELFRANLVYGWAPDVERQEVDAHGKPLNPELEEEGRG